MYLGSFWDGVGFALVAAVLGLPIPLFFLYFLACLVRYNAPNAQWNQHRLRQAGPPPSEIIELQDAEFCEYPRAA